jgi:hypothetical protein
MSAERDMPSPTPRERLVAAQRLALGDEPEFAAAEAGIEVEVLERLLGDPAFVRLRLSQERLLGLTEEAWGERLQGLMRFGVENALAGGRVSTVNMLLRERAVLRAGGVPHQPRARMAMAAAVTALDRDDIEAWEQDEAEDEPPLERRQEPVESEPEREAARQVLLARLPAWEQRAYAHCSLTLLEQYAAACDPDPTVYEAWLARQAKPAPVPVPLSAEERAAILYATRHNPPWLKGEYLGYHRPPVPREAFDLDAAGVPATGAAPAEETAAPVPANDSASTEDALGTLRARIQRLLDRAAPRLPEELDLAEAICAVKWPKWPEYRGSIDLWWLRRALTGIVIDPRTLNWLGSRELEKACKAAQGP